MNAWAKANVRAIERSLEAQYGKGWRACFPVSVQNALIDARILGIVMGQALETFGPAQKLVQELQNEVNKE